MLGKFCLPWAIRKYPFFQTGLKCLFKVKLVVSIRWLFGSECFVKSSFVVLFNPLFCEGSDFTEMVEYVGVWDGLSVYAVESFSSTLCLDLLGWMIDKVFQ